MLPLALLSCAMGLRARALAVRGGDKVPLRGGFAYGGQKKPVFYDMTHSNNAARVRLWLRLVDPALSQQVDSTFITYDDLRSEEYGRLNPLRKVPALVRGDGGTVFESDVILKYLEDLYGNNEAMTPSTPEGRQVMNLFIRIHDIYISSPNCSADGFCHSQGAMYLSTAWHGARRGMDIATREAKIAEIFKQLTWLEANKVEGPCPEHKTNFVPAPVLP